MPSANVSNLIELGRKTVKCYGPPGTGKTEYLLKTVEQELNNGVKPDRLAFMTFTTSARKTALGRMREKFGLSAQDLPYFRTLHSTAYRQLGLTSAALIKGPQDLKELGELLHLEFHGRWVDPDDEDATFTTFGSASGDQLLAFDHYRRHSLMSVEDAFKQWDNLLVTYFETKRFCDTYVAWKKQEGFLDFTDLLEYVEYPLDVDVIIVDEAQDLSRLQWKTLDTLASTAQCIYLAGDDDQAIFEWAGASAQAFIERPGKTRVLDQSYRLPKSVWTVAQQVAAQIHVRHPKVWRPRADEGKVERLIDPLHADYERDGSYLILYRNHYQGDQFESHLQELGLPYTRSDRAAPGVQWSEAILFWERLRKGIGIVRNDVLTLLDALTSGRDIKRGTKGKIQACPEGQVFTLADLTEKYGLRHTEQEPWYEALGKIKEGEVAYLRRIIKHGGAAALSSNPKIRLSTVHAAKGDQADNVVLLTDMSRQTRDSYDLNPDPECRVWYVGATRAKHHLTIIGMENPIL